MGSTERPGSGVLAWGMSQAAPFLMRRAAGRVLVWVWKADPELVVVMAQVQEATPQLRAARAMMPMEYDDSEEFRNPYLGVGEKLAMPLPRDLRTPPFATYTWDTGTHFVSVTAVCPSESGSARSSAASTISRAPSAWQTTSTIGESPTVLGSTRPRPRRDSVRVRRGARGCSGAASWSPDSQRSHVAPGRSRG